MWLMLLLCLLTNVAAAVDLYDFPRVAKLVQERHQESLLPLSCACTGNPRFMELPRSEHIYIAFQQLN